MKKAPRKDLRLRDRLILAGAGLVIILVGYAKVLGQQAIYENQRGESISAYFIIFLGFLSALAAVFPWGHIQFLRDGTRTKHRR